MYDYSSNRNFQTKNAMIRSHQILTCLHISFSSETQIANLFLCNRKSGLISECWYLHNVQLWLRIIMCVLCHVVLTTEQLTMFNMRIYRWSFVHVRISEGRLSIDVKKQDIQNIFYRLFKWGIVEAGDHMINHIIVCSLHIYDRNTDIYQWNYAYRN